jgi:hypothetical protein
MHLADREFAHSPLNDPPEVLDRYSADFDWGSRRKVLIYGGGLGKREAPLDDPGWSVWAINLIPPLDWRGQLRADLWFDLHQRGAQTEDDMRWISGCPFPIVVPPDLMDATERAVEFPLTRIRSEFPNAPLACSFAYQIALALSEGFKEIGLFGVELAYGSPRERTVEWASVNWWLGLAEGRGVKIHRPLNSRLGRHPRLYGLEYDEEIKDTRHYLRMVREIEAPIDGVT